MKVAVDAMGGDFGPPVTVPGSLMAAEERGVTVINTPEAPADSVAELTIGLMIALARKIVLADSSMKQGRWIKKELKGL